MLGPAKLARSRSSISIREADSLFITGARLRNLSHSSPSYVPRRQRCARHTVRCTNLRSPSAPSNPTQKYPGPFVFTWSRGNNATPSQKLSLLLIPINGQADRGRALLTPVGVTIPPDYWGSGIPLGSFHVWFPHDRH